MLLKKMDFLKDLPFLNLIKKIKTAQIYNNNNNNNIGLSHKMWDCGLKVVKVDNLELGEKRVETQNSEKYTWSIEVQTASFFWGSE